MKTIWVVEQGCYSDYKVVGVFTSKANAKKICDCINTEDNYSEATIAEWPLDPAIEELRKGYNQYLVWMDRDGVTERCDKWDISSYDLTGSIELWRRSEAPAYRGKDVKDVLNARVWAKDDAHAIKIVNEQRTTMIATGKWK